MTSIVYKNPSLLPNIFHFLYKTCDFMVKNQQQRMVHLLSLMPLEGRYHPLTIFTQKVHTLQNASGFRDIILCLCRRAGQGKSWEIWPFLYSLESSLHFLPPSSFYIVFIASLLPWTPTSFKLFSFVQDNCPPLRNLGLSWLPQADLLGYFPDKEDIFIVTSKTT